MRFRPVACACLMTLLLPVVARSETANVTSPSDPDRTKAAQFFRAGQDAFSRGDYAVAAHSFEQAHQLLPSGPTIYNAARAWDRMSQAQESLNAYEEALTQADLSDAQRGHAQKRVEELHKQGIASTRKQAGPLPAGPSAPSPGAAPTTPTNIQAAPTRSAPLPPAPPRRINYLGWTGVTLASVSALAAGACGWMFVSQRSDFIDTGKTNADLRSDAVFWGKLTTVALATTLVGTGVAVWGFHRVNHESRVALQFTGTGFSLGGAF